MSSLQSNVSHNTCREATKGSGRVTLTAQQREEFDRAGIVRNSDGGKPVTIGEVWAIEPVLVQFVGLKAVTGPILTDRKELERANSTIRSGFGTAALYG
jgi:hypothetical protein